MKVTYLGQEFEVDEDCAFIAADDDGSVFTYTNEPTFDGEDTYYGPGARYVGSLDAEPVERDARFPAARKS